MDQKRNKDLILGVKITGSIIAMEEADLFGDLSKYDFILKDQITYSYNGNVNFACEIEQISSTNHFNRNGWELERIELPGNWYGQSGNCIIKDKFGEKRKIKGCNQRYYVDYYEQMLTECIKAYLTFADKAYCEDAFNFMNNWGPKLEDINSPKEVESFIKYFRQLIKLYFSLVKKVEEDSSLCDEKKQFYLKSFRIHMEEIVDNKMIAEIPE